MKIRDPQEGHPLVSFLINSADATSLGLHVCSSSLLNPFASKQVGQAQILQTPHFQADDRKPSQVSAGHFLINCLASFFSESLLASPFLALRI